MQHQLATLTQQVGRPTTYVLFAFAAGEVEQEVELEVVEGPGLLTQAVAGELLQGVLVALGRLLDPVLLSTQGWQDTVSLVTVLLSTQGPQDTVSLVTVLLLTQGPQDRQSGDEGNKDGTCVCVGHPLDQGTCVCVGHPLDHHSFKTMGFTRLLQLTVVYTHNFNNYGLPQFFTITRLLNPPGGTFFMHTVGLQ